MKKQIQGQKGFTLVEILIVIVILAILAAIALPRLLSQPERAHIAEAQNTLGILRRAQQNYMDTNGVDTVKAISCAGTALCEHAGLKDIGVKNIPANPRWKFECADAGATCVATRLSGNLSGATITLNVLSGAYTCDTGSTGSKYAPADSNDLSKGCQAA